MKRPAEVKVWRGKQKESEKEVRKEDVWIQRAAFRTVVKALQTKVCQLRRRWPLLMQRRYAKVINDLHGPVPVSLRHLHSKRKQRGEKKPNK